MASVTSGALAWMVSRMIRVSDRSAFRRRRASIPLTPGIVMSVTMTSGFSRIASSTSRLPSLTAPTTSNLSFNRATRPSMTIV